MDNKLERMKLVFSRWIDIGLLAGAACFIYFILHLSFKEKAEELVGMMEKLPALGQWLAYFSTFFGLGWFIVRQSGSLTKGLRSGSTIMYPPFWFACFPSILLIYFVEPWIYRAVYNKSLMWDPQASWMVFFAAVAGSILAWGLCVFREWLSLPKKPGITTVSETNSSMRLEDSEAILKWIEEEVPITATMDDFLGTDVVARRIAGLLEESPSRSIALVGSYGSGKSSILNMAEHYLKYIIKKENTSSAESHTDKETIVLVKINGWGLLRGSAAERILDAVVRECGHYIDCSRFASLPSEYSLSVRSVGWGKTLAPFLSRVADPVELLKVLDNTLHAVHKKVIVLLEDLDRNLQGDDFWSEVVSLLDRLKRLESVSFVLAITDSSSISKVIYRIADHLEVVPSMSGDKVRSIYNSFRKWCLHAYEDVAFANEEGKQERVAIAAQELEDMIHRMGIHPDTESTAIINLIDNPRNFKHILRRTYRIWQNLNGEIDFEDVFVANILRVAEPAAFSFIHDNILAIRWLQTDRKKEESAKERERLSKKLNEAISGAAHRLDEIEKAIRFLFPYWVDSIVHQGQSLQGVSRAGSTDYWNRLIQEQLDDSEISDQQLAKSITRWKENNDLPAYDNLKLASALYEVPRFAEKLGDFGALLDAQDIRVLAQQLFEIAPRSAWDSDQVAEAEDILCRLAKQEYFAGHGDWAVREVGKLFPISLSGATRKYQKWLQPMFWANQEEARRARKAVLDSAKLCYTDPNAFLSAVASSHRQTVLEFILTLNHAEYGGSKFEATEWAWLADLLIATAHMAVVIPQIVGLGITRDPTQTEAPLIFKPEPLQTLFQEKTGSVMNIIAQADLNQIPDNDRISVAVARTRAI